MKNQASENYAKLLDAWVAPKDAGEPVGCLATSFTFDPTFFEEECLTRFLDIQADPDEDGPVYLIEREEKLAATTCSALVDARHSRGARSLRWDLLPARIPGGAMHAKVSLLVWQFQVRLIVASANLTADGYRRNQEIFGVLDFYDGSPISNHSLNEVINFLSDIAQYTGAGENGSPALERWKSTLDSAGKIGESSGTRHSGSLQIKPVLIGPNRPSAFERLGAIWPGQTPPTTAHVVSPFFDQGENNLNIPAKRLWQLLRQRGAAEVTYNVTAEETPDTKGIIAHAPASLLQTTPSQRNQIDCRFAWLAEHQLHEDDLIDYRPLHAKTLTLYNNEQFCMLIGSSNFTSSGLGTSSTPNVEANLAYCVSLKRDSRVIAKLEASQLRGKPFDTASVRNWEARGDETTKSETDWPSLPKAFRDATLSVGSGGKHQLTLRLEGKPPAGWLVFREDESDSLYSEAMWHSEDCPADIMLILDTRMPPTGLEVGWDHSNNRAWWPVNVLDATVLPPAAELRELNLEALIHILTSSKSLKEAMRSWMRNKQVAQQISQYDSAEIDPHKRVDTSRFLLQRTRRFSWALAGLRKRLERPVPTFHTLHWRLHGPVGVARIARALHTEKRSDAEYAFLLTELVLELSRVHPSTAKGCLCPNKVRQEINHVARDLIKTINDEKKGTTPATCAYIDRVLSHFNNGQEET